MQVHFYLPEKYLPDAARREAWKTGTITALEEGGKIASAQAWIFQTWQELQSAGCSAALVSTFPETGLVLALAGSLDRTFRPPAGVFLTDIVADGTPHPGAHWHVVQNPAHARRLPRSSFLPHWTQPNLLPRDAERKDRFETLGFFGDPANLAPELRDAAWQAELLRKTGLTLKMIGSKDWHDYRAIDAVLAVREFGRKRFLRKPATKLYNAWLAGVPFIGGSDSAYRQEGNAGQDHLTAASRNELEAHLSRLKDDPAFRHALVRAGHAQSRFFNRSAICERWVHLIKSTLPEAAAAWSRLGAGARRRLAVRQSLQAWIDWHLPG